jgi:hypothetical protein
MILARTFLLTLIFAMSGFNACPQTLQTLVSFANTNGAIPTGLTLGNDGNFYGLTDSGGNTNLNNGYGYGTVFSLTTNGLLTTLMELVRLRHRRWVKTATSMARHTKAVTSISTSVMVMGRFSKQQPTGH